jgi:hypothetical protein
MTDTRLFASDVLDYLNSFNERVTGAVRAIDTDHSYIHEGIMFSTYELQTISAGGTSKISLTTPGSATGTFIHWRPSLISTSGDRVTVTLYEDNSVATGGAALTPINRDRMVTRTAQMTVKAGVTITSAGTAIDATYIGGGTSAGGNRNGAETGEKNEIVMKQSTEYSVVTYNGSTAAGTVFVKLLWYEELGA